MKEAKLLELIKKSDVQLLDGVNLSQVQEELRNFEKDINVMPLAERFQMACYAKSKAKSIGALIHCRGILQMMIKNNENMLKG